MRLRGEGLYYSLTHGERARLSLTYTVLKLPHLHVLYSSFKVRTLRSSHFKRLIETLTSVAALLENELETRMVA